ncbi:MAG: class I SAM-dependent methyltransferase [Candidatus Eremiobacteraeota bacterium]|nr:class I SAM-dependent methyltransferase [Candidatus Eremiobacteraeota bacterium]
MTSIKEQVDYYNREWSIDERSYPNAWQLQRAIAILREIAAARVVRPAICELGAGTGWLTAMLGAVGDTLGVELSNVAVEAARRRFPHVRFTCADVTTWEYPQEAFDVAVSHEVIEHVDDQQAYVDAAHGLLKRGGRLILTTPNASAVEKMRPEARSHQPNENVLTARQLRTLLQTRFANVRVRTLILGGATRGIYRVLNAQRVHRAFHRAGLFARYEGLACRAGLGLHLLATADKV